jgi:hypothetical protein
MAAFYTCIIIKTSDDIDRLYYLDQHLAGSPKKLIAHCFHMRPNQGYHEALRVLEERYGDPYRIAMAYMKEIKDVPWMILTR